MKQDFFEKLIENIYDGVYYVDLNRCITYWNRGAERLTGYGREAVMGKSCADNILRHVDDQGNELCLQGCPLADTMIDGRAREAEVFLHHRQGHRVPVFVRGTPMRDAEGKIIGAVEVFSSNTKNVQAMEMIDRLQQEALKDALTGLGNRRFADMNLSTMIHGLRENGVRFGVLLVDADHFKAVNDTWGHNVGDEVLKMLAGSISAGLRALDVPCRWGGEEFIVLLPNVTPEILQQVGERLRMLIENSWIEHDGQQIRVTASLGGAFSRPDDTATSVVERADDLLYQSKAAGRNRVSVEGAD